MCVHVNVHKHVCGCAQVCAHVGVGVRVCRCVDVHKCVCEHVCTSKWTAEACVHTQKHMSLLVVVSILCFKPCANLALGCICHSWSDGVV